MKALEASCYTVVHASSGYSSYQNIDIFFNEQLHFSSLSLSSLFVLFLFTFLLFSVNELFSKAEERLSPAHLGTLIAFYVEMKQAFCLYDLFLPPFT